MVTTLQQWQEETQANRLSEMLDRRIRRPAGFEGIVGAEDSMLEILDQTKRAARTDTTVLITGESGTGKELIAQAIRQNSPRRDGPFVTINMAAVPEALVESELFGHVKGSFTGAAARRTGRIEAADGGTLFIDEIGDLALSSQAKLLRVLEDYRITPVGGNEDRLVDVRLVAATSRDIQQMVRDGEFREDLYYRLNVVNIDVPPLRQRRGDILLLVRHFMSELCEEHGKPDLELDPDLLQYLIEHDWPGNVRQLRNCIESMVVLSRGSRLTRADLPPAVCGQLHSRVNQQPTLPVDKTLEDIERLLIMQRLDHCHGNRGRTAASLGISLRTLQRKLKKWRLSA